MKKLTFLFALLCASVMGWAGTKYCNYEMTAGGHTVYFSAYKVSEGNYQIKLTSTDAMDALSAGCYMNVNGVGGYQMLPHSTVSNDKKTITVDIAGTPGTIYNPLYIMMPGEVAFTAVQNVDIDWENTCEGGGDPEPGTGGGEEPEPDPNSYTAGGHTITLDASYVVDGSNKNYTLVITSTDDMDGLGGSFWNVNGVGTDMRTNMTVSGDKKTITCTATSTSNPNIYTPLYVMMPGEVNFGFVTLNWENRTPITSEYCNYQGSETHQDDHYFAITFETDASGNVVITIGDGTGAGACSFRNGGFEGGNNGLNNFVVSDDDFATTTPATDYFTVTRPTDGDLQYILTKTADLPANAKIKHLSAGAIAWREAGADRWCFPEFIYTYGGTCNQLDAPTNVSIDANNIITFDAVSGADSYTAYVSLSGVHKYSQVVASGDELTFVPLVDGAYDVTVVASGSGKTDSDPSAAFVWNLEAVEIVLGNSEYCERIMQTGTNTEAAFTWETDGSGNIVITISETLGGAADASHFRNNALALANFKVGTGQAAGSNYFSHPGTTTGNQLVLTATNAPAPGEKIYYHGTVEYATSKDGNAWPTLDFEWTYGTVCAGKSVSATPNNNTMGSAVVKQGDDEVTSVEEGTSVTFIATVADVELYRFVNWTKGGVEVSTNASYTTTITESTNLIANFEYIRNTYCHAEINSIQNKKLYMTLGSIGGGQYQIKFEGSAEAKLTALTNANYTVNWVTTDIVDGNKPMSGQDVPFNNARWNFSAAGYGSATMTFGISEGKTWEDIYVWNHAIYFMTAEGEVGYTEFPSRYHIAWDETCADAEAPVFAKAEAEILNESSVSLNIQASDNWEGILTYTIARAGAEPIISNHASGEEFTQEITGLTAGTEYDFTVTVSDGVNNTNTHIVVTPVGDEVKPVMGAVSLASKTWNSAIINVAATDNKGVTAYYVVEKDADYIAAEDKITVEGLTAATAYTLHIKAKDAAGNISDNQAEVSFTTDAHAIVPAVAAPVPTWPATQVKSIYSDAYDLAPANTPNYNAPWWQAPAINLSDIDGDHFMDYDLANDGMIGWQYDQISVASMEKLHIDIYASAVGTVSVRPITDGDGALNDNRKSLTLAAQQWNSFDIELSEFGAHDWTKLFQFSIEYWMDGGLLGEHISVDNVYFYRTTAQVDNEKPTNVTASVTRASFGSITLNVSGEDNEGTVLYSIKIGETEYANGAATSGASKSFTLNGLTPGTNYTIRVIASDESGNVADPVIVPAQTNAIAPAPVPAHNADLVRSVYSDKYESALAHDFLKNTWTGIPYTELNLSGDHILAYTNPNSPAQMPDIAWGENSDGANAIIAKDGFNDGTHKGLDVRNMQYIHFDIWSSTATTYPELRLNDTQAGSIVLDGTGWQSFDLPLASLTDEQKTNIRWIKFIGLRTPSPEEIVIDNVYFWQYGAQPNQDNWATFASSDNIRVPNDVTVYTANYSNVGGDEQLILSDAGKVIPANTGVMLRATALTTFGFTIASQDDATAAAANFADNDLVGCATRTDISDQYEDYDIFCMRRSDLYGFTGFFLYTGQYIPAGKAYLPLPKDPALPAPQRRVRLVIDNTDTATAIDTNAIDTNVAKFFENGQLFIRRGDVIYTIQGVRVK